MKKLNLLTLICALVMGLSLTSCLDSGDSGTSWEDARTVYVRSYLGQAFFVDAYGVRYYPSTESLNAFRQNNSDFDLNDYKMMNIYFNYHVEEDVATTKQAGSYVTPPSNDIDLVAYMVIEMPEVLSVQSTADLANHETAPVIPLEQNTGYGFNAPQQLDEKTVLAYTGFYLANDADKLNSHKFRMVYVKDEITAESKDLTLYVCHNRGDDDKTDAYWATTCGFDMQRALEEFRDITGNDPEKIILKAKTSNSATTTLPSDYSEYDIDFQTFEEMYSNTDMYKQLQAAYPNVTLPFSF